MALVSQLSSQVRLQLEAHQGQPEARLTFNQSYFNHMKTRASEPRASAKCPWAFRLTAAGLDLALLNEQWRSLGFTLGQRAGPYYLLTEMTDYHPVDLETKLWRGLIISNYQTWYEQRLRHLVKAILAILVRKEEGSEDSEDSQIQSYTCQPTDGLFCSDLQSIFSDWGWRFTFFSSSHQRLKRSSYYSITRLEA